MHRVPINALNTLLSLIKTYQILLLIKTVELDSKSKGFWVLDFNRQER